MKLSRFIPRLEKSARLDAHRLQILTQLRWYALSGVTVALAGARLLSFKGLAWSTLAVFVLLGAIYNILLSSFSITRGPGRFQRIYYLQLILDISALTGLLWASGGLANPFATLFLLHVVVAALIGPLEAVIAAGALASAGAITLHVLEHYHLLMGRWAPPRALQDTVRLAALLVTVVALAAVVGTLSRRFQAKEARLSEAQQAVRLREQVLERVLNGLSAAVEVVQGSRVVWQNEAMTAIRRLSPDGEWMCPGNPKGCNRAVQDQDGSCAEPVSDEPMSCLVSVQQTSGAKVYRKYAWRVLSDGRAETVHLYVDETRRLTEEERLKLTERLASLGRMAQGIAHELNTPLSTVRTLTQDVASVLRDELQVAPATRADLEESLSLSLSELDRCARITRGLLNGRGLEGSARPQYQALRPLVDNAVTLVSVGSRRMYRFEVEVDGSRAYVDADALVQVLVNLLSNAVDASPAGSVIEIAASSEGGRRVLTIADRGDGLAPDIRGRLFEPFATTKPVGQGTGLGLYMARLLLAEVGGTLELQDRPGGGAVARVTLRDPESAALSHAC